MAKVSKGAKKRNVRFEAAQLLGQWTRLAQGHVFMGGNCSCGVGGASVRVEEFEQQILDYLGGKFGVRGESIAALLRSITADAQGSDRWLPVLDALSRTLESFEQAHRGA